MLPAPLLPCQAKADVLSLMYAFLGICVLVELFKGLVGWFLGLVFFVVGYCSGFSR